MGFLKMAKNDKNINFLPVSRDAIFGSFQGEIISHCIDTSMISKTGSSFYLISDKAFLDRGFTFDRFIRIKNKRILHFVLKICENENSK